MSYNIKSTVLDKIDRSHKISVLHGTDWWTDCDDVAALQILCKAHNAGIIDLKCVGINAVMEYSAASVDAFLQLNGIGDVEVGVDFNAQYNAERTHYQKVLAQFPHTVSDNNDCMPAYKLYRKCLAQTEGECIITEVGFPQIIMQLLKSEADEFSPLNGTELVKQKVSRIWMMAGAWNTQNGREYNLTAYPVASEAGDYICKFCPVPVTFLGFEVGESVISGSHLPQDNPVFLAFNAKGCKNGRSSWDPMLVLAAVIGDLKTAGYTAVSGNASVDGKTGTNNFVPSKNGNHSYLVKVLPDTDYAKMIDDIII